METLLSLTISALDKLTSAFIDGECCNARAVLQYRLDVLHRWLDSSECAEDRRPLNQLFNETQAQHYQHHLSDSVIYSYSMAVLSLLHCVHHYVTQLNCTTQRQSLRQQQGTHKTATQHTASLQAGTLGSRQLSSCSRGVQFVSAVALLPALPVGVGVTVETRSVNTATHIRQLVASDNSDLYARRVIALSCVERLLRLTESDSQLSDLVLADDNLCDIVAFLALLAHGPRPRGSTPLSSSATLSCCNSTAQLQHQRARALQLLEQVMTGVGQLRATCILLHLQRCACQAKSCGGRAWMWRWCWRGVHGVLSTAGGLVIVTQALLHFWAQDRVDLVEPGRIQAVAKLLTSPPPDFQRAQYLQHLATEVLSLLRLPRVEARASVVRVAGAVIVELCTSSSSSEDGVILVADHVLTPLLGPLSDCHLTAAARSLDELEVTVAVEGAWQLFVAGMEPCAAALSTLRPYAGTLMLVYSRTWRSVSHLRRSCGELLARLVRSWGGAVSCRRLLLAVTRGGTWRRRAQLGDSGGVTVSTCDQHTQCTNNDHDNDDVDDERVAGAFIHLLSGEQDTPTTTTTTNVTMTEEHVQMCTDALVFLVSAMKHSAITSDSDEELSGDEEEEVAGQRHVRCRLLCVHAVCALLEQDWLVHSLVQCSELADKLLPVLATLLQQYPADHGDSLLASQTLATALALAGVVLSSENSTSAVWQRARHLLEPVLSRLTDTPQCVAPLRQMAADLRQMLLTNGVINTDSGMMRDYVSAAMTARHQNTCSGRDLEVSGASVSESVYETAMAELCDPMLPVRAHAIATLSRLLQENDPHARRNKQHLFDVFKSCLTDEDSYLYLAAVRGLSCLAHLCTDEVLPRLCQHYRAQPSDDCLLLDIDTRLKLGQALVQMLRQLGDMAPKYSSLLLHTLLCGCRSEHELIRASSLSNLAQLCSLLKFSLVPVLNEVLQCVNSLVDTDPSMHVRRAAVLVVVDILHGLSSHMFQVLEHYLLQLYRRLKLLAAREQDPVLLAHTSQALHELARSTRHALLSACQQPASLVKHIHVLQAPPHL